MAVPSYEMSAEQIHGNIMTQFKHHVEIYKLPQSLTNMPWNNFFRTTKHVAESVTENDIHTGTSLWRKFSTIKRYVNNIITPIYIVTVTGTPYTVLGSFSTIFTCCVFSVFTYRFDSYRRGVAD